MVGNCWRWVGKSQAEWRTEVRTGTWQDVQTQLDRMFGNGSDFLVVNCRGIEHARTVASATRDSSN
jgi:hypothetical protein